MPNSDDHSSGGSGGGRKRDPRSFTYRSQPQDGDRYFNSDGDDDETGQPRQAIQRKRRRHFRIIKVGGVFMLLLLVTLVVAYWILLRQMPAMTNVTDYRPPLTTQV